MKLELRTATHQQGTVETIDELIAHLEVQIEELFEDWVKEGNNRLAIQGIRTRLQDCLEHLQGAHTAATDAEQLRRYLK